VTPREAKQASDDPGARIDEIVGSVERATDEIRREAEREASRYLQNRRREADQLLTSHRELLVGLAAGLDEAAETLRAELNRSVSMIEEAAARLRAAGEEGQRSAPTERSGAGGGAAPAPARTRQAGRSSEAPARVRKPRNAEPRSKQDAVMLRATEMAIAGRRREEIAAALKSEYGVSDPNQVLERILGLGY
jgi:hypothetical protein